MGLHVGEVFTCNDYGAEPEVAPLELCWRDSDSGELADSLDEAMPGAWSCEATQRHAGPCLYHCGAGRGCNALDGCWGCS